MRKVFPLAAIVLLALQFACTPNPTAKTAPETKMAMTDSDLKDQVEAKITSNPEVKAANLSVSANAERNTVALAGTVESEALRNQAVALAKDARPGLVIEDKIDVKPRELSRSEYREDLAREERGRAKELKDNIGDSLDDAWIHAKIVTKLIGDTKTPEHRINVDVKNNVVTLRGTVESAEQKAEAARLAKETDGVKRVNDQLRVAANKD